MRNVYRSKICAVGAFWVFLVACSNVEFSGKGLAVASGRQEKTEPVQVTEPTRSDSTVEETSSESSNPEAMMESEDSSSMAVVKPEVLDCISMPADGQPLAAGDISFKDLVRTTYFFRNVAVDPQDKGDDRSASVGLVPFPLSPKETLSESTFALGTEKIIKLIQDDSAQILEWTGFGHEFLMGLDRVSVSVTTRDGNWTADSLPDIYSHYGYVTIKNMQVKDGIPRGDIGVNSFGYAKALLLNPSPLSDKQSNHDGTKLIESSQPSLVPLSEKKDADLRDLVVKVRIYSDLYDSVQYRAVRASIWAKSQLPLPAVCK